MELTVSPGDAGARLDRFLSERTGLSRRTITRLIRRGDVLLGHRRAKKGAVVAEGDVITLLREPEDARAAAPLPQPELALEVLYVDGDVVAVNKQAGLPSHPLLPGERGTVASALVARYPECVAASEHGREGGLCHRLDIHTSGVLLAARKRAAWRALRAAFHDDRVSKEYLALCVGSPAGERGAIALPLLPQGGRGERVQVAERPEDSYLEGAMEARTEFEVLRRHAGHALLRVRLGAGRRHQIRAHLAYLGLPLYGDVLYGGPDLGEDVVRALGPDLYAGAKGQFLHASRLIFPSPTDGRQITVEAPLPPPRQRLLEILLG